MEQTGLKPYVTDRWETKFSLSERFGNKIFGAGADRWLSSPCVAKNFWLYLSPLHGIVSLSFD